MKGPRGGLVIRRMKPSDRTSSFFTSLEMAKGKVLYPGKPWFVVVRRGLPVDVMAAGRTKRELKSRFFRPWKETANFFKVQRKP